MGMGVIIYARLKLDGIVLGLTLTLASYNVEIVNSIKANNVTMEIKSTMTDALTHVRLNPDLYATLALFLQFAPQKPTIILIKIQTAKIPKTKQMRKISKINQNILFSLFLTQ